MTAARPPANRRRDRGTRRAVLLVLALGLVFAVGVALGRVTASSPESGPSVTTVRTIVPLASTRETVTVTTTVSGAP